MRSPKLIHDEAVAKTLKLISVIENCVMDVAPCDVESNKELLAKVTLQMARISKPSRLLLYEFRAAHSEVAWGRLDDAEAFYGRDYRSIVAERFWTERFWQDVGVFLGPLRSALEQEQKSPWRRELIAAYPQRFRRFRQQIAVGDGWRTIITEMIRDLEAASTSEYEPWIFRNIEEHLGAVRVEIWPGLRSAAMIAVVEKAIDASRTLCQGCGAAAVTLPDDCDEAELCAQADRSILSSRGHA